MVLLKDAACLTRGSTTPQLFLSQWLSGWGPGVANGIVIVTLLFTFTGIGVQRMTFIIMTFFTLHYDSFALNAGNEIAPPTPSCTRGRGRSTDR